MLLVGVLHFYIVVIRRLKTVVGSLYPLKVEEIVLVLRRHHYPCVIAVDTRTARCYDKQKVVEFVLPYTRKVNVATLLVGEDAVVDLTEVHRVVFHGLHAVVEYALALCPGQYFFAEQGRQCLELLGVVRLAVGSKSS